MKQWKHFIWVVVLAMLPVAVVQVNTEAEPLRQAIVYFTKPAAIETTLDEIASYGLQVIELRHSNYVLGQDIQGGYFPDKELSSNENAQKYEQAYSESLTHLLDDAKEAYAYVLDEQTESAWQQHILVLETALAQFQTSGLNVMGVLIQGETEAIGNLISHSDRVRSIEFIFPMDYTEPPAEVMSLSINPSTWLPNRGRTIVRSGNSQDTERYVHQTMIWTNISGFGSNSTYEHDFFLYNYDGKTYLSRSQGANGIPTVTYWGSNLPRAYLDTRFDDPAGEVAYVIGCADGSAIQLNTWYWSQIRTSRGDANTDLAKLFGQRGYRSPSSCYTTWCVFASQTEPVVGSWSNPWAISVPADL